MKLLIYPTYDVSQSCLVIRYLKEDSAREDFVSFVDVYKINYENLETDVEPILTNSSLGKTFMKLMYQIGLNLDYCVGI